MTGKCRSNVNYAVFFREKCLHHFYKQTIKRFLAEIVMDMVWQANDGLLEKILD